MSNSSSSSNNITAAAATAREDFPTQWFDFALLRAQGGLSEHNVLDYFSKSPYFDPTCGHAKLLLSGTADPWDKRNLRDRNGTLEYNLRKPPPDRPPPRLPNASFFVIEEQWVEVVDRSVGVSLTNVYIVQNGVIFPAPNVRKVLKNRLENTKDLIETTFNELEALTSFSQTNGTGWLPVQRQADASEDVNASTGSEAAFSWKNDLQRLTL